MELILFDLLISPYTVEPSLSVLFTTLPFFFVFFFPSNILDIISLVPVMCLWSKHAKSCPLRDTGAPRKSKEGIIWLVVSGWWFSI